MYPRILQLYGPIWINSYGLMIALGFSLFVWLCVHDRRYHSVMGKLPLEDVIFFGLLVGIIGGRMLFVIQNGHLFAGNWIEIFFPWVGGFSLLGTMLALLIFLPIFLRRRGVAVLPFFDLITLYVPLLQGIARIGCFFAGCCFGANASSNLLWGVCYAHPDSLAPLGIVLHPTQLYSSIASLVIFLVLYLSARWLLSIPGRLTFCYLMCELSARFIVDFWRGNRELEQQILGISTISGFISPYQQIIGILFLMSAIGFFAVRRMSHRSL